MDEGRRDQLDGGAILDVIEEEVVPLYYARNASGLSPEWVRRCKHAMASVMPRFNMRRAVRDYAAGMYSPAAAQGRATAATTRCAGARNWRAGRSVCAPALGRRAASSP